MPHGPFRIIGVTGGIGAGKSTVVAAFARRGAIPFSADAAVHELYADPRVRDTIRERWGSRVFDGADEIDRSAIAGIVFNDEAERRWLEGLLHPLVGRAWERFVAEQQELHPQRGDAPPVLVAEVPLLFEAGLEDRYDVIVAITAPLATRIERAEARGSGRILSAQRDAAQMPESAKAERADFTYANTGSVDDLDAFAASVLEGLD